REGEDGARHQRPIRERLGLETERRRHSFKCRLDPNVPRRVARGDRRQTRRQVGPEEGMAEPALLVDPRQKPEPACTDDERAEMEELEHGQAPSCDFRTSDAPSGTGPHRSRVEDPVSPGADGPAWSYSPW